MPLILRASDETMIIAKTVFYRKQRGKARSIRIAIHLPEQDPRYPDTMRCRINLTDEKLRFSYGIDSFQALNLAFVILRAVVARLVKSRCVFYFDRQLKYRYDVQALIFNDASFYEQLGKQMTKRKMEQWKKKRRKPHV